MYGSFYESKKFVGCLMKGKEKKTDDDEKVFCGNCIFLKIFC